VDIKSLGELSEEQFEEYKGAIGSEVRMRRAKHAVYENQRTLKAVEALKENDVETFGKLMNASHVSLRDDYAARRSLYFESPRPRFLLLQEITILASFKRTGAYSYFKVAVSKKSHALLFPWQWQLIHDATVHSIEFIL